MSMGHGVEATSGWIESTAQAWPILAAWVGVVQIHGLWRSSGEAAQDTIRPSGPIELTRPRTPPLAV